MTPDPFEAVQKALETGGFAAGIDFLENKFRAEKQYPQLFEALLMKKRSELGLPLVQSELPAGADAAKRTAYEEYFIQSARQIGLLFLDDGNIERAWPYFRAIGERAPVAEAIEKVTAPEGIDRVIEIALQEGANPRKGFELLLSNYGICRAITFFEQYPDPATREQTLQLLVRTLHHELVASLKRAIAHTEGQGPETNNVRELIAGRDWLFGEHDYYVDTSHLVSIIRYSLDLKDRETLALAIELTEYGRRLSTFFKFRVEPPFEDIYADHAIYFRALLGEDAGTAIAHFRRKVDETDPEQVGTAPAQILVTLLVRLERYSEAIDASLQYLRDVNPSQLSCPSAMQLCQMAADYSRLRELAREQGDLLNFFAASAEAPVQS